MDPDTNLTEQRELAQAIITDQLGIPPNYETAARELANLVLALDAWLRRGGFLPTAWRR